MKVENRKSIRRLALRSLKANKRRNLIATTAIILTAVLFTTLFTILMSINASYETSVMRELGGSEHGTFKSVTDADIEVLSADKRIKDWGIRTVIGMNTTSLFKKRSAEISYMDDNITKWSFIKLKEGHLPKAENEVIMDTEALAILGVEPVIGAEVTIPFSLNCSIDDGADYTDTFVLAGYWEYDRMCPAHFINVSKEYADKLEKVINERGLGPVRTDMSVMLRSSLNIDYTMATIAVEAGYDIENANAENFLDYGANPAYRSINMSEGVSAETIAAILAFSVLIAFTGYLIIYNVFQISVAGDIKFYGLLKTIGVTSRQLKRIIRIQALVLCVTGIPAGLLIGYGLGAGLTGLVLEHSNISGASLTISTSPVIFLAAAVFELVTVLFSTSKPGRMAAAVSPVEALRYTEGAGLKRKSRATKGAKVRSMAFANMGRNKKKTVLVFVSLALAIVLLNSVFLFVGGFDSEKWLDATVTCDFVVGKFDYFKFNGAFFKERGLAEEDIAYIKDHTRAKNAGIGYDIGCYVNMVVDEKTFNDFMDRNVGNEMINRGENGEYFEFAVSEAMDEALIDKLTVYEGDAKLLNSASGRYVAFIAHADEFGNVMTDEDAPKVGDKVKISFARDIKEGLGDYVFADMEEYEYTVAAYVEVPTPIGPRRASRGVNMIFGAESLSKDLGDLMVPMIYAFDAADPEAEAEAEAFLAGYSEDPGSEYMYESKAVKRHEFDDFRNMFLVLGGVLCGIVGVVGVLNYFNAVLAGILARKNEIAVLQAIGMTGRQVKEMLMTEGIIYSVGSGLIALVLSLAFIPVFNSAATNVFWFYSKHFTIAPVLTVLPVMASLGILIPLMSYGRFAKASIVERIREIGT
ncbi:MAG: ABC transporter permease [Lachnospiraceae bacterium]|nr:ABC transporter permease [Lachnospiraceae bacterium]